jgi:hypothetical protein
MPASRDLGGLGIALVDHPSAWLAFGVQRALVVDVAELVFADLFAEAPGEEPRVEVLAVPPGEYLGEKGFHRLYRALRSGGFCALLMAARARQCKGVKASA